MTVLPEDVITDPRPLVRLMDHILATLIAHFEAAEVTLPERRYWTMGLPAADCEQLTVSFAMMYVGPPGDQAAVPQRCESPRSATFNVQLLRCIPTAGPRGGAPTAASIQKASEQMAIDAYVLLESACACDSLWDPLGGPGLGVIATVASGEAQGGFQGPTMTITLAIP